MLALTLSTLKISRVWTLNFTYKAHENAGRRLAFWTFQNCFSTWLDRDPSMFAVKAHRLAGVVWDEILAPSLKRDDVRFAHLEAISERNSKVRAKKILEMRSVSAGAPVCG
jgi:hypothetical protein